MESFVLFGFGEDNGIDVFFKREEYLNPVIERWE